MRMLASRAAGQINRGAGIAGTLALHGMLVLTVILAGRTVGHSSSLPAYRVELIAAPRASSPEAGANPPAASAPAPAPAPVPKPVPRPASRAPAPRAPAPTPRPAAPSRPTSTTPQRPPAPGLPQTSAPAASAATPGPPVASPNTAAAPGTGTDAATIRTEGVEFPFPGYLRNLVAQVYRRWRPPAGNADLEAEMLFFVHRDGSISGLQFMKRSGAFAFDLEAQGAVEAAARAGAFGTLPEGFGPDLLPVSFFFSPRSLR